jgi:glycosyltransferase involved in cell wall biosynthesis
MAFQLRDELGLVDVEFAGRLSHESAIALIKKVDLALGIFGDTEKATRVIPNKLLDAMACRTVVLTGRNSAMERYFRDGKEVYYCTMGDAQSLADAILRAYKDRENHDAIRVAAREVIERELSVPKLKERLLNLANGSPK